MPTIECHVRVAMRGVLASSAPERSRTTASIISDACDGLACSQRSPLPRWRCHRSKTSIAANPSEGRSRTSRLRGFGGGWPGSGTVGSTS